MQKDKIEAFREYLIENERSENTIQNYMTSIDLFFRSYDELSKKNLVNFKNDLFEKGRSPKTVSNRCIALNQFCKFLGKPEMCVKKVKIHQSASVENVITVEEFNKLLDCLLKDKRERDYWIVMFLGKTGARASEFVRLEKSGLKKGYCEMWTKGKIRRIYIPKPLIEKSKTYFEHTEGDLLFPSKHGKQMSTRGIAQKLVCMSEKYGIRKEVMHPHSFRHLYAIEFLKKNPNVSLLADLMGHSSVSTTSIYLKLSREEQMKQFNEASSW